RSLFCSSHPPTSILFPYPPLFRSWFEAVGQYSSSPLSVQVHLQVSVHSCHSRWAARPSSLDARRSRNPCISRPGVSAIVERARTDRKSTRLNSSHLGISYAVFCLN